MTSEEIKKNYLDSHLRVDPWWEMAFHLARIAEKLPDGLAEPVAEGSGRSLGGDFDWPNATSENVKAFRDKMRARSLMRKTDQEQK